MYPVAGFAGHGRLIGELCIQQTPRTLCVWRLHELANRSSKVHAVTTKTVFHQGARRVRLCMSKDFCVRGAVGSSLLCGILLLVASATIHSHRSYIGLAQSNVLGPGTHEMHPGVP